MTTLPNPDAFSPAPRNLDRGQILDALDRLQSGDFAARLPDECADPTDAAVARTFNAHVAQMRELAAELTRLSHDIGTAGRLGGQIELPGATGAWQDLVQAVNADTANLTAALRDLFRQITRVAGADFSQDSSARMSGELLETQQTLTVFSDQLAALHRELIRLAEAQVRRGSGD